VAVSGYQHVVDELGLERDAVGLVDETHAQGDGLHGLEEGLVCVLAVVAHRGVPPLRVVVLPDVLVNGVPFTQPFDIVKDPAIPSSDADIQANTAMQIRMVKDINTTVEMINRIEIIRKQIEDLVKANKGKVDFEKTLMDLDRKIMDVELQLLSRTELHSDDKWYVEAYKIYLNLLWHYGEVAFAPAMWPEEPSTGRRTQPSPFWKCWSSSWPRQRRISTGSSTASCRPSTKPWPASFQRSKTNSCARKT